VGPRVGLDVCEKSRLHRDSIPGPSSPQYKCRIIMNLGEGKEKGKQLSESTNIATIHQSREMGARYKSTALSLRLGYTV
jgi:hypothetical protein